MLGRVIGLRVHAVAADDERVPARRNTSTPRWRVYAWLLLATCALLLQPAAASAGTYDVWSCQTPSGQPTSAAGWRPWSGLLYDRSGGGCERGRRGLTATFSARTGGVSSGLAAGWTFRAPSGTTISAARVTGRAATSSAADRSGGFARAGFSDGRDLEAADQGCGKTDASCTAVARNATVPVADGGRSFSISAGCTGAEGGICARGEATRAKVRMLRARITLSDTALPRGSVSGPAVDRNAVRGKTSLRVNASDVGSGVWQVQVQVGSTIVLPRTTLDDHGGRCRQLAGSTAFSSPVPCPRKVDRTLRIDTSRVPDGSQMLSVTLWDAANNPVSLAFQPVLIDNARNVRADGTILMPAIGGADLDPLLGGGGSGPAPGNSGDPELQPVLDAMHTLASMQLPYCYGGGHGSTPAVPGPGSYCWIGNPAQKVEGSSYVGFDCSSSVSWVLQQAGYDVPTMTSGSFMNFGEAGQGRALTIWTNPTHVFIEVEVNGEVYAWGTSSSNPQHGPGWHAPRSTSNFVARHIPGL